MDLKTTVLLDGLAFPESPRWRDGKLWFVDTYNQVMTVDLDGNVETIVEVPNYPGGLGWLCNGRLLVASTQDRRLLRLDPGGLAEHADLSKLASGILNDMVVDGKSRAYVGSTGFNMRATWEPDKLGEIVLVTPDGDARVVAGEIAFANGTVITPDGRTLIIAESSGDRLTAFEIQSDGSLAKRRVWAELKEGAFPDGICFDAEGAVWVAAVGSNQVLRVREGGEVIQHIGTAIMPIACTLGGPDRRTLFVLTKVGEGTLDREKSRVMRSGRVEIVQVDVPGAGLP
jgi:sugar lactone lactonase YvrE